MGGRTGRNPSKKAAPPRAFCGANTKRDGRKEEERGGNKRKEEEIKGKRRKIKKKGEERGRKGGGEIACESNTSLVSAHAEWSGVSGLRAEEDILSSG